jgi:hypothetical protein
MTQQRSMFGGQGGIFGRPLKLAPTTSPLGRSQGVLPQGPAPAPKAPTVSSAAPAPQGQVLPFHAAPSAPAPAASFNSKRVPMGNPGDCPICH